ncbi:hypothetical protein K7H91_23390 [Martelella mediterranea]|uniref:hypothetical protein n=1 Tax=Martelella mediterranea TaxID=293089 RepID=UPI001E4FB248|nr:hypothetical protein [Martelella mediterranea]MCD1636703.1 hypothetical protein [Martelella mediterranea]
MRQNAYRQILGFWGIQYLMARYVRILTILILAVFVAGTVVHAANAAAMSTKMTLAAIDGAAMGDCKDCPDNKGDMQPCDNACLSPLLAVVPSGEPGLPEAGTITENLAPHSVSGHSGLPDPYPPRTTNLS